MIKCFFCKKEKKRLRKADNGKLVCDECSDGCKYGYHHHGMGIDPTGLISNTCEICGYANSWFRL